MRRHTLLFLKHRGPCLSAISLGERGTCGLRSCVDPDPVTAQVIKTSRFICSGMASPSLLRAGTLAENLHPHKRDFLTEADLRCHLPDMQRAIAKSGAYFTSPS